MSSDKHFTASELTILRNVLAADVRAFIQSGKTIQQIPMGATGYKQKPFSITAAKQAEYARSQEKRSSRINTGVNA